MRPEEDDAALQSEVGPPELTWERSARQCTVVLGPSFLSSWFWRPTAARPVLKADPHPMPQGVRVGFLCCTNHHECSDLTPSTIPQLLWVRYRPGLARPLPEGFPGRIKVLAGSSSRFTCCWQDSFLAGVGPRSRLLAGCQWAPPRHSRTSSWPRRTLSSCWDEPTGLSMVGE